MNILVHNLNMLNIVQVLKQGITETGAKEFPAPVPLLLSLVLTFHYILTYTSQGTSVLLIPQVLVYIA